MLETYWPEAGEINACIKNEAETADVSVLVAVHQPTPLIARAAVTNRETATTEKQLLDFFLTEDVPSGYILCPITGPSGVGKSHVIRWLDAQLQRLKRSEKLLVIRIPKSASLRKVVELILEPLADNPRFVKPREELNSAVAAVDPTQVIVRFIAELQNALVERAKEMRAQLAQDPSRGSELRPLIGHAEQLPKLFRDAVLHDHYSHTVFSRIISRATLGRDEESVGGETDNQFLPDDLLVPETVALSEAAHPVRTYYLSQVAVADATRRDVIVKLLNSVIDRAIGHVFRLEQSSGGLTLQDIILGVRETLLGEGKDLVLLVEDFAALAGIQEALLNVCIQEGTRDGKKIYATMRTALALTDGYLTSRETILTRAQRVWAIGGIQQNDDEITDAAVEMVGAYLNAARWGEKGLKARFQPEKRSRSLTDWLPIWEDEQRTEEQAARLQAFGYSNAGHALFPFNRDAIRRLVGHHLTEGGHLAFNPRRIINEILRNTLLDRESFVKGEFPPAQYHGLQPNGYLAALVRQTNVQEPIKRRLQSALAIWGGDASDARSLSQVPPLVFETFSLPTPQDLTKLKFEKREDPPLAMSSDGAVAVSEPVTTPNAIEQPTQDRGLTEWRAKLDRWATKGEVLAQADSRNLRSAIQSMLQRSINWSCLRIPDIEIRPNSLWIAGSFGNPTTGRILTVCKEQSDDDGSLREAFLAVLRFKHYGNQWDYPEGDDDYIAATDLIEKLRLQLEPLLVADAKAVTYSLGQALLTQARICGMQPPLRMSNAPLVLAGLFDQAHLFDRTSVESNWDQLRAQAVNGTGLRPIRPLLQEALRDRCASYQGDSGRKPFAVDTARVFDALGLNTESLSRAPEGVAEEIRNFLPTITDDRIWNRIQGVLGLLRKFRENIGGFLADEKLDKNAFVGDLKDVVVLLQRNQCWPSQANVDMIGFERDLNEFQGSRFAELVSAASIVDEATRDELPKVLNALGALDLGLIQRTLSFLQTVETLVTLADPRVTRQEEARRQSDPSLVVTEINRVFDRIGKNHSVTEAGL
ncbi:hypothetical protein GR200_30925 [Rhizobium leguminosarum]|uniref:protein DpdH n=1 Tax=Rhizobium leguminosarum TaxID=384 RepID=UPI0013BCAED0|nr:protein DpdH [Rhizobium leguminosarum]NEI59445.1 hypothetical protein [Rhizobium leguminosarum]NEI88285.1 hypothetical protein [Rhizobium leguminosarum]